MRLNFKTLKIKKLDGEYLNVNLSREIANLIYNNTRDISDLDKALQIYKKGEVELSNEDAESFIQNLCEMRIQGEQIFPAIYQIAFKELLETTIK